MLLYSKIKNYLIKKLNTKKNDYLYNKKYFKCASRYENKSNFNNSLNKNYTILSFYDTLFFNNETKAIYYIKKCSKYFHNDYLQSINSIQDFVCCQIKTAEKHFIDGFIFDYPIKKNKYLKNSIDYFVENSLTQMRFCLCLNFKNIKKKYFKKLTKNIFDKIKKYTNSSRYLKINGKLTIFVTANSYSYTLYLSELLEEILNNNKIYNICIIAQNNNTDNLSSNKMCIYDLYPNKKTSLIDYQKYVECVVSKYKLFKTYKNPIFLVTSTKCESTILAKKSNRFGHYCLRKFYQWNLETVRFFEENKNKNNFLILDSWNNLGSNNNIEPDNKYGYSNINTFTKALLKIPYNEAMVSKKNNKIVCKSKIAVQVHIFYIDLLDEIFNQLDTIPFKFDLYITTNSYIKKYLIISKLKLLKNASVLQVDIFGNIGRDVAPFVLQFQNHYLKYEYLLHIHTKKSTPFIFGDLWRKHCYSSLLASTSNVNWIFSKFISNKNIGIIYPDSYPFIYQFTHSYGDNLGNCKKLLHKLNINSKYLSETPSFSAGTMFWARTAALKKLFAAKFKLRDFKNILNQKGGTIAHAIESCIGIISESSNFINVKNINLLLKKQNKIRKKIIIFNVYNNKISLRISKLISQLKMKHTVFIASSYIEQSPDILLDKLSIENEIKYICNRHLNLNNYEDIVFLSDIYYYLYIKHCNMNFINFKIGAINFVTYESNENNKHLIDTNFLGIPIKLFQSYQFQSEFINTITIKKEYFNFSVFLYEYCMKNKIIIHSVIEENNINNNENFYLNKIQNTPITALLLGSPVFTIDSYKKISLNEHIKIDYIDQQLNS